MGIFAADEGQGWGHLLEWHNGTLDVHPVAFFAVFSLIVCYLYLKYDR